MAGWIEGKTATIRMTFSNVRVSTPQQEVLLWVDHNTTRFSSVLQNNYSSWVQNKQHGGTAEASSSCPHALVNQQLHHIRGGGLAQIAS